MTTLIVKSNKTESINSNLKFRILMNGKMYDRFVHETYSSAKDRFNVLKKIFEHSTFDILVEEA